MQDFVGSVPRAKFVGCKPGRMQLGVADRRLRVSDSFFFGRARFILSTAMFNELLRKGEAEGFPAESLYLS